MTRPAYIVFAMLLLVIPARAQVVINELCARNGSVLEDEDDEAEDWVELYNTSASPVPLNGFTITDDPEQQDKWTFPNVSIPAQSFLLVFLSGKDRSGPELHANFKLSEDEQLQLYDASQNLLGSVQVPGLQLDHSYGGVPDGGSGFLFFASPTPGASNSASPGSAGYAPGLQFNPQAGFHAGPVQLQISCTNPNAQIRYTLNGSEPTSSSPLYTGPIWITATNPVRARAFEPGLLPSDVRTETYFIGVDKQLPVISLSTDSSHLFDWNTGIYVYGPNASSNFPYYGANFWREWERPLHIEMFDEEGALVLEQDAGVQINGGSVARTRPMKSLRIIARGSYGDGDFDYQFFPEKAADQFKVLVLRNASGDFCKMHFRDGFAHNLILRAREKIDVDVLGYRPAAVYINGDYWGIHNIREKVSKHYLAENYGVDPENVDLLEEDTTVIQGDFTVFNAMHAFVTGNDMSLPANYDSAAAMIDIESFCDYFITETFFANIDWPYNNIKFWRERAPGRKWRYILIDLDAILNNNGWAPASLDALGRIFGPYGDDNKHVQLLKSLLANEGFRHYFINRYADLVNTEYSVDALSDHLGVMKNRIVEEMDDHMLRWGFWINDWHAEINAFAVPFVAARPQTALDHVQDTFNLEKQVQLSLDVWPPGAGTIRLNTIHPSVPWSGTYFDGVPVAMTAIPAPGYRFAYWRSDSLFRQEARSAALVFNPDADDVFTAYFAPEEEGLHLSVFPNPVSETAALSFVLGSDEAGSVEVFDALGRQVYHSGEQNFVQGPNLVQLPAAGWSKGVYIVRLSTPSVNAGGKMMKN